MAYDGFLYKRSEKEWNKSYTTYLRKTLELAEKLDGHIKQPMSFGIFKRTYSLIIRGGQSENVLRTIIKRQAIVSGPQSKSLSRIAKNISKILGSEQPILQKFSNLKADDFRKNTMLAQEFLNIISDTNLKDKYGIVLGMDDYYYGEVDIKNKGKKSKVETPGEQFAKLLKGV